MSVYPKFFIYWKHYRFGTFNQINPNVRHFLRCKFKFVYFMALCLDIVILCTARKISKLFAWCHRDNREMKEAFLGWCSPTEGATQEVSLVLLLHQLHSRITNIVMEALEIVWNTLLFNIISIASSKYKPAATVSTI